MGLPLTWRKTPAEACHSEEVKDAGLEPLLFVNVFPVQSQPTQSTAALSSPASNQLLATSHSLLGRAPYSMPLLFLILNNILRGLIFFP